MKDFSTFSTFMENINNNTNATSGGDFDIIFFENISQVKEKIYLIFPLIFSK